MVWQDAEDMELSHIERPEDLPALVLAYVGDAVFELAVRCALVAQGQSKVRQLHQKTVAYVNATAQAGALRAIEEQLTEEEKRIVRRGRNTKTSHAPRHAHVLDYHQSTGLECLVGYLYLKGERQRLDTILRTVLEKAPVAPVE